MSREQTWLEASGLNMVDGRSEHEQAHSRDAGRAHNTDEAHVPHELARLNNIAITAHCGVVHVESNVPVPVSL